MSIRKLDNIFDLINGLKAKYGRTIGEIFEYRKLQEEKLEKLRRYEENLQELKDRLEKLEKVLAQKSDELSEIRKEYSTQLEEKIIQGLKDLNSRKKMAIQTMEPMRFSI